jgi:hypothetical protein
MRTYFEYKGHTVAVEGCYIRKKPFTITIDERWQTLVRDKDEVEAIEIAKQIIDQLRKAAE